MNARLRRLVRACLLGSLFVGVTGITGCDVLGLSRSSDGLTFVNRADRAFAPITIDAADLPLIDPRPYLTEEEFEERKIVPESTAVIDDTGGSGGYERADNLHVILYAQCDCDDGPASSILTCPREAPFARSFSISAVELVQRNHTIVVEHVPAPQCRLDD